MAAVSVLSVLSLTGCAQFDKALGQQQAMVSFKAGASNADRLQVRTACGTLPNVHPAPIAKGVPLSSALGEVEFRIDKAGAADVARLQQCLAKYPQVTGISIQDSSDNG